MTEELPGFTVEATIRYRNPLRHGIRGEDIYLVTVHVVSREAAYEAATAALRAFFEQRYGYLVITSLRTRAAVVALAGAPDGISEVRR